MQSPRCIHACFFRTKTTLFLPAAIVMCVTVFRSGATAEYPATMDHFISMCRESLKNEA